jgi:hypothetical protein
MTKFADQLFDDLMREHGPALAHARPPAPVMGRITPRRTLLAAGGALAAAAAVTGALVAGGEGPAGSGGAPAAHGGIPKTGRGGPGYAVTKNPDGTISLAVYRASGIAGANARLRQLGDPRVVVVPVRPGCRSIGSLRAPVVPTNYVEISEPASAGGAATVTEKGIPAGDFLVFAVQVTKHGAFESDAVMTSPPLPGCVSLPPVPAGEDYSGASVGSATLSAPAPVAPSASTSQASGSSSVPPPPSLAPSGSTSQAVGSASAPPPPLPGNGSSRAG